MLSKNRFTLRLCLAAVLLAGSAGAAQARVSVDIGIGLPFYGAGVGVGYYGGYGGYRGGWGRPWGPGVVVTAPVYGYGYGYPYGYYNTPVVVQAPPQVIVEQRPTVVAAAPSRPDPVIYPRNAQTAQQTEYDRQECNRWATTQQAAMADASVFQRAVEACMDGRGYTMR